MHALLAEQRFMELLEARDTKGALAVLRNELAELCTSTAHLSKLSRYTPAPNTNPSPARRATLTGRRRAPRGQLRDVRDRRGRTRQVRLAGPRRWVPGRACSAAAGCATGRGRGRALGLGLTPPDRVHPTCRLPRTVGTGAGPSSGAVVAAGSGAATERLLVPQRAPGPLVALRRPSLRPVRPAARPDCPLGAVLSPLLTRAVTAVHAATPCHG